MAQKLVNLLALLSIAVVGTSYGVQPANALAAHGANHLNRADHHALAAKKQRRADASSSKRCRKRPWGLSSSIAQSTSSAVHSSSKAESTSIEVKTTAAVSTKTAAPATTPKAETTTQKATTKTSSSAAQTTTKASSGGGVTTSNGHGKVGLAWPNGNDPSLKNFVTGQVSWIYTWSPEMPSQAKSLGLNTIPMLWGAAQESDFVNNAAKNSIGGWLASFNEPNQSGQSNLSPEDAAAIHMRAVQPFSDKGYKIIAPVTSSAPNGLPWVQDFMKACKGCKFDAIALHYYDISVDGFIKYIELWRKSFPGMPIFVTEFADQNFNGGSQASKDEVWAFWSGAIKYMNSQDDIIAYFGFGVMHDMQGVNTLNQLMASSSYPTDLGYTYINNSW